MTASTVGSTRAGATMRGEIKIIITRTTQETSHDR
jgi:hypothetical protein